MAAATPEVKAKRQIQAVLKEYADKGLAMKLTWNAGAAFGTPTVDCTGVIAGVPVAFEVKRFDGKGKLTARQLSDLKEFHAAGAVTMLLDSPESLASLVLFLTARLDDPTVPVYRDWSRLP